MWIYIGTQEAARMKPLRHVVACTLATIWPASGSFGGLGAWAAQPLAADVGFAFGVDRPRVSNADLGQSDGRRTPTKRLP